MTDPRQPRFDSKWIPDPTSGCWLWTASVDRNGYGWFQNGVGRAAKAHRISHELHVGPIPRGLNVCHKCDVPGCVNPDHLFLGTHKDNVDDKVQKGRQAKGDAINRNRRVARGERNGNSKLKAVDVKEIRRRYAGGGITQAQIGSEYNVSQVLIGKIVRNESWAELEAL